jgi:hypothetical protein
MPPARDAEYRFWESVIYRLLAIFVVGLALVLLFRGYVIPSVRNEMREEGQKALDLEAAP